MWTQALIMGHLLRHLPSVARTILITCRKLSELCVVCVPQRPSLSLNSIKFISRGFNWHWETYVNIVKAREVDNTCLSLSSSSNPFLFLSPSLQAPWFRAPNPPALDSGQPGDSPVSGSGLGLRLNATRHGLHRR